MKLYTIVGGVNGVGKSSLTGVLRSRLNDLGTVIDVDLLTARLGGDEMAGGRAAIARMEDCLAKGVSFTQETTLSGFRTERTARRARALGYSVRLFYVGLDAAEECRRRIANRVAHGGHDIPSADVDRRFQGRWEALARVLPYCDEAFFYDNDNGFRQVAVYRAGELIPEGEQKPAWLRELADYLQSHL